jgi:hypothetical protein
LFSISKSHFFELKSPRFEFKTLGSNSKFSILKILKDLALNSEIFLVQILF